MLGDDEVSPTRPSLLGSEDYHPLPMPGPCFCSAVPRLLAFLAVPLSNPREEADGPHFLCTNQGGICSLTDTSPLTYVSSHIHYSFSLRWAAVKGREQSGGWAGEEDAGWRDESLSCSAPAASSSQCSSVPQSFIPRQGSPCNIWVKPNSSMLCFLLPVLSHSSPPSFLFSGDNWGQTIWTAEWVSSRGDSSPVRGPRGCLKVRWKINVSGWAVINIKMCRLTNS